MLKTTILPGPAEIMRRLKTVNDSPWNVEKLYPLIAAAGGSERAGAGLNLLFELAFSDVCDGDPLLTTLRLQIPAWMLALVDDKEVLDDALAAFETVNASLRSGAR